MEQDRKNQNYQRTSGRLQVRKWTGDRGTGEGNRKEGDGGRRRSGEEGSRQVLPTPGTVGREGHVLPQGCLPLASSRFVTGVPSLNSRRALH
ncbi:hypothetical protein E2C01_036552 [Portunus trituberculatus]|uniref:Uncharacterized protein n=1 Tax=Portunus trituberculatus TaxID=210409 RepID=A0A5B7FCD4_PORTR|nr:hypothetical protein [Portunus trituberculatus]